MRCGSFPRAGQLQATALEGTIRVAAGEIAEQARDLGDGLREAARALHRQVTLIAGAVFTVLGDFCRKPELALAVVAEL